MRSKLAPSLLPCCGANSRVRWGGSSDTVGSVRTVGTGPGWSRLSLSASPAPLSGSELLLQALAGARRPAERAAYHRRISAGCCFLIQPVSSHTSGQTFIIRVWTRPQAVVRSNSDTLLEYLYCSFYSITFIVQLLLLIRFKLGIIRSCSSSVFLSASHLLIS